MYVKVGSSILSRLNFLATRNIYNQDDIQDFIKFLTKEIRGKSISDTHKIQITKWINRKKQGFKDYLAKNIKNDSSEFYRKVERVHSLPVDAPDWLKEKFSEDAKYFQENEVYKVRTPLKSDHELVNKVTHIIDYLIWYLNENPGKALTNVTWTHVKNGIKKWEESFKKEESNKPLLGEKLFIKTVNGYSWIELTDKESLDNEGSRMGHCVGDYCDRVTAGDTKIYSLRDSSNRPRVTVEYKPIGDRIIQVKAKGNDPLPVKYSEHFIDFMETLDAERTGFTLSGDVDLAGIYFHMGSYYSMRDKAIVDGELVDTSSLSKSEIISRVQRYPVLISHLTDIKVIKKLVRESGGLRFVEFLDKLPPEDVVELVEADIEVYSTLQEKYTNNKLVADSFVKVIRDNPDRGWTIREGFEKLPKGYRDNPDIWSRILNSDNHSDLSGILDSVDGKSVAENFHRIDYGVKLKKSFTTRTLPEILEKEDYKTLFENPGFQERYSHIINLVRMFSLSGALGDYVLTRPETISKMKDHVTSNLSGLLEAVESISEKAKAIIEPELASRIVEAILKGKRLTKWLYVKSLLQQSHSSSLCVLTLDILKKDHKDVLSEAIVNAVETGTLDPLLLTPRSVDNYISVAPVSVIKKFLRSQKSITDYQGLKLSNEILDRYFDDNILDHILSLVGIPNLPDLLPVFGLTFSGKLLKRLWDRSDKLEKTFIDSFTNMYSSDSLYNEFLGFVNHFGVEDTVSWVAFKNKVLKNPLWMTSGTALAKQQIYVRDVLKDPDIKEAWIAGYLNQPHEEGHKRTSYFSVFNHAKSLDTVKEYMTPEVVEKLKQELVTNPRHIFDYLRGQNSQSVLETLVSDKAVQKSLGYYLKNHYSFDPLIVPMIDGHTDIMREIMVEDLGMYKTYQDSYPKIMESFDINQLVMDSLDSDPSNAMEAVRLRKNSHLIVFPLEVFREIISSILKGTKSWNTKLITLTYAFPKHELLIPDILDLLVDHSYNNTREVMDLKKLLEKDYSEELKDEFSRRVEENTRSESNTKEKFESSLQKIGRLSGLFSS